MAAETVLPGLGQNVPQGCDVGRALLSFAPLPAGLVAGVAYESHTEFLIRLLRPEWHARQQQCLVARIKRARLPELWALETFPYAKHPGVNRRQIRGFAELDFIAKAENIVFIGKTVVGKTGLACGILLKDLENGFRGQFVRALDLFDEMGYLNVRPEQSNIFFKLMEERYRRRPPIRNEIRSFFPRPSSPFSGCPIPLARGRAYSC